MADSKITALASISTSTDPAVDPLVIVDVSDTSMAATGTTKKVTLNNLLSSSPTATGAFSVTGLVTAGSAAITGAATVGTTFAVGTVTPDIFGRFYTRSIGFDSSGTTALQINGTSYSGVDLGAAGVRTFGITASGTDANISTVTNIPMLFGINNAEALRLNSTANLVLKGGTVAANGVGVTFPATQVASSDANCLDDYEEGIWDASFISGGGTVTINPALNRCRYTKTGRLVTVNGLLQVSSVSSPTGPLLITGLPFTIPTATEGDTYSAASLSAENLEVTATGQIVGFGSPSTTSIYLYRYQAGALIGLAPSAKASSEFVFTLTYSV